MSDKPVQVPPMSAALRAAVRDNAAPVRPVLAPRVRASIVVAIGIAVAALDVAIVGLRGDAARLGPVVVWLPAALRLAAGAWLVLLAMREASPSEGPARSTGLAALAALPLLLAGSATALVRTRPGSGISPLACYAEIVALAVPAMVGIGWLLSRGFALRPVFAAVAGGLGASVLAETALHLTCPATSFEHNLLIHGGAVASLALVALGWGLRSRFRRL